jgi:multidrug resistance efflux pump
MTAQPAPLADQDEPAAAEAEAQAQAEAPKPRNPIRRIAIVVLAVAIVLFLYSVIADRLTPYTDQATVQAYIVGVAPDVAGRVIEVNVSDNQAVEGGQVLFRLDPERHEIAVEKAEADLAAAGQSIGSSTAAVAAAEAGLAEAEAQRANIREQTQRMFQLVKKGVYAKARGDQAQASLDSAEAEVRRAEAEVEQARQSLGPQGHDNPQIRQAMAAIRQARRDLADTAVLAPSIGVVSNLQLAQGEYLTAGQDALTFIDAQEIWIEAHFRENSLENLEIGDPVEIVLDIRPGRIYAGRILSIGWGVANREIDPATGLPKIRNDSGWIRDPQRFAVRIDFEPNSRPKGIRLGSQANVIVYAASNPIVDALGWVWIRLVATFSFLT